MKAIIIVTVVGILGLGALWLHAYLWFHHLRKAAHICAKRRGENLCVRTDGLFPRVGKMPPANAMWRVRTGMYCIDGSLVFTYRYDPNKLDSADLDDPDVVNAEMRALEAHGRELMEQQANT
ncbi:MAG TPA: hypothetical protein VEA92_03380 [Candidatus Paceibacterota bacterium]|nr:hypothetical protein [Candidatus Paceibacterota bacterium]